MKKGKQRIAKIGTRILETLRRHSRSVFGSTMSVWVTAEATHVVNVPTWKASMSFWWPQVTLEKKCWTAFTRQLCHKTRVFASSTSTSGLPVSATNCSRNCKSCRMKRLWEEHIVSTTRKPFSGWKLPQKHHPKSRHQTNWTSMNTRRDLWILWSDTCTMSKEQDATFPTSALIWKTSDSSSARTIRTSLNS